MNNRNKLLLAVAVALASFLGTSFESQSVVAATFVQCSCGQPECNSCVAQTVVSDCTSCAPAPVACGCGTTGCKSCLRDKLKACRCGKSNCRTCRLRTRARPCTSCNSSCGGTQCPSCDEDICKLELDNSKIKKTCFKVEQKSICIPPVRFPWQKCCPPGTSKTKLVNRLSKHTYECPNCAYKWTLQEPKALEAPAARPTAPAMPQVYETYPVQQMPTKADIMQTMPAQPPMPNATPIPANVAPVPTTTLQPTWRVESPLATGAGN